MRINPETKTGRLLGALKSGDKISASEAQKRFGIKNISAEASRIRQAGYVVYARNRKAANHAQVTEYELGAPSKRLIRAGYLAIQLGLA
jgi:hypothetical protein